MILAPLRGVTIRCFREVYADVISAAGFAETVTPFIPAMNGVDPLKDRELMPSTGDRLPDGGVLVTPQFIGKDPAALRTCLERVKAAGYETADLNCGCPFPMVRNKGRGSGILRTPDVLRQMMEVGCSVMGDGNFSIKARLGVDRNDELLELMPIINAFPLRCLTVHARNARQMYAGNCDHAMFGKIAAETKVPLTYNGDVEWPLSDKWRHFGFPLMVGRGFVRHLGTREDAVELLKRYIAASREELCGDRPILGRMKELIAYWKDQPQWRQAWNLIKVCRSVDELLVSLPMDSGA